MRVEKSQFGEFWTVAVEPGELITDSGKPLPYATTIGIIKKLKNGKMRVKVWTPAAYKPRGYPAAAKRMLERALVEHFPFSQQL